MSPQKAMKPDWVLEILEIINPLQEDVARQNEALQGLRLDLTVLAQQICPLAAALSAAHARVPELEQRIERRLEEDK
ncbi:MAG: hypothetical protein ACREVR_02655 [Burkholderiales bacterium]